MKKEQANFFWNNIDWWAVILCSLAACIFWLFNAMNHDYTGNISYPIEVMDGEENIVPSGSKPKEIIFNATGQGWDLLRKTIPFNLKPLTIKTFYFGPEKYIDAEDLLPLIDEQFQDIKINYVITDTLYTGHMAER